MDFALNEDQLAYKAKCRRFAAEVIRPVAAKHDAEESTPWEAIKAAREHGLSGIEHLRRLGSDADGQLGVIGTEELHWGCAGIALAISGSGLAAAGIAASGTPEQIARWVPECFGIGDEIKLGAYAVTEAQAGSDVRSMRSTAKRDGEEWVLDGTKVFITNGGIADVHVVLANVAPELGHRGQASFIVPKGTPGLSQGKKETKIGIRASHTAELVLEECRIPLENLLGGIEKLERKLERARSGESSGRASNALATFELTRPLVGASALGIAQAAYEWTLAYLDDSFHYADPFEPLLDESSTAGRPALERQGNQQVLAQIATEIDAARLLVQRASWMGRNGIPLNAGQGSMSKLKSGQVAVWVTRTCMDLIGPAAGSADCPLEKWFRDAKIYELFEGTAEIQRLVISRMQADEYRRRLASAAEIADAAMGSSTADGAERTLEKVGGTVAATA